MTRRPTSPRLDEEARCAWELEARLHTSSSRGSAALLLTVAAVGAWTLAALALRFALAFPGRTWELAAAVSPAALSSLVLAVLPWLSLRRARARAVALIREAGARAAPPACPRCGEPLRDGRTRSGACDGCGAASLEARGLCIHHISEERWRRLRWRSRARARLRATGPPSGRWLLSPLVWLAATVMALLLSWAAAAGVETSSDVPSAVFRASMPSLQGSGSATAVGETP